MKLLMENWKNYLSESKFKNELGGLSIKDYDSTYDEEIMALDEVIFGGADKSIFEESEGFVALDENQRLVGYILYQQKEDNFHIRSLGVDKSLQKNKIGTKLLEKVVEIIDEANGSATLSIDPNFNLDSDGPNKLRSFYGRYGFKDVGKKNSIGNVVLVRRPLLSGDKK